MRATVATAGLALLALAACSGSEPEPAREAMEDRAAGPVIMFEESCCENDLVCQDGNWCNGIETCDCWGECGPGEPPCQHDPDPDDPCLEYGDCIIDRIDAPGEGYGMGHCEVVTVCETCTVATDCSPAPDACHDRQCVGGYCQYPAIDCDDGDVCTNDSCDPATGCVNQPIPGCCDEDADCDDGDWCNGDETCDLPSNTCEDPPDRCTGPCETCNEATDSCDPIVGGSCTVPGDCCGSPGVCNRWHCIGGNCVAQPLDCDDGNPCTDDSCNPGMDTCVHIDNSDPCTNDSNECTLDQCDGGSCQHIAMPGAECNDDGDDCNGRYTCDASGSCNMTTGPVTCPTYDCRTLACQPATGSCVVTAQETDGTACSDEGASDGVCTDAECSGGHCVTVAQTGDLCSLSPPQACAHGECNAAGICQPVADVPANNTCGGRTPIPSVGGGHWQTSGDTTCATNDYSGSCGGGSGKDVTHALNVDVGSSFQMRGYQVNMNGLGWNPVLYDRHTCSNASTQMQCNDDCFDTQWSTCSYGGSDSGFYIPPLPIGNNEVSLIPDAFNGFGYGNYVIDVQSFNVENGWPCDQTPGNPDTFYGPDVTYGGTWRGHIVNECAGGPDPSGYFNAIICDPAPADEPVSLCYGQMDWWYASRSPGPGCWQGYYLWSPCWFGDNCRGGTHYWWEYCDWPANAWFVIRTPTRTNYRFSLTEGSGISGEFDGVISVWHLVDPNVCFFVEADSCFTDVGFSDYTTPWMCLDAGESYIIGVSKRVRGDSGTNYELTVQRGGPC